MNENLIFLEFKIYHRYGTTVCCAVNPAQTSHLAKTRDYITNAYLMPRLDYVMFYCVHLCIFNTAITLVSQPLL